MTPWQIREARQVDADDIARIHIGAWQAAYRGLLSDEVIRAHTVKRHQWWASYLHQRHSKHHVLVAADDEHIVGFGTARPSPDDDAEQNQAESERLVCRPGDLAPGDRWQSPSGVTRPPAA
jgi:hypothetical protein